MLPRNCWAFLLSKFFKVFFFVVSRTSQTYFGFWFQRVLWILQEISCFQNSFDTNIMNAKSIDSRRSYVKALKKKYLHMYFMPVLNLICTFCLIFIVYKFKICHQWFNHFQGIGSDTQICKQSNNFCGYIDLD